MGTRSTQQAGPSQSYSKPSKLARSSTPNPAIKTPASKETIPLPTAKSTATKQHPTKAAHSIEPHAKSTQKKSHADPLNDLPSTKLQTETYKIRRDEPKLEFNGRSARTTAGLASDELAAETETSGGSSRTEQARSSLAEDNLVKLTMRLMKGVLMS